MSQYHIDTRRVIREVQHLSHDEAENLYGIRFTEDNQIIDTVTNRIYQTIEQWAEETAYEEEFEHFGAGHDEEL